MKKMIHDIKQAGRMTLITILSLSILVVSGGFYYANTAKASGLSSIRATLSTSSPSSDSNWELQFVTDTLVNENDTITIDIDTLGTLDQFDLTGITEDDVDILEDTDGSPNSCSGTLTQELTAAAAASSTWAVTIATTTDTITLTAPTTAGTFIAASACIVVRIGTNATSSGTGANQINNPAKVVADPGIADIYDVAITFAGNSTNSGSGLVAVIAGVTVSVSVDESLTFTLSGVASSSCTQGGTATAITTTSTTVPFGSSGLSSETFYKGCHDVIVGTNASQGYTVSVQENRSLLSGTDTIDDTLCDAGDCTEVIAAGTTTAWATATNNGFGYTCSGSQCNAAFNSATEFSQFPCTGADAVCDAGAGAETATTPISHSTSTSAQTNRIVYKLSFDTVQPAGDYSNTITYIATPTF